MNPTDSIPRASQTTTFGYGNDLFLKEDDSCCYCGNALTTELEAINQSCLACMAENEREAKLNAIDELTSACRAVLHLTDIVAEDIRPSYRSAWDKAAHKLCSTLNTIQCL
ncbi:MAG: hypothetical protein JO250_02930 [Armatimonadetes bacterium]|nr:hypothetical protein [Armatimonadota bacterium]